MAYTTETYFLTILEAGKSKVKVSADSVPGERTVFGLGEDAFLLYPRVAENKRGEGYLSSSYKATVLS